MIFWRRIVCISLVLTLWLAACSGPEAASTDLQGPAAVTALPTVIVAAAPTATSAPSAPVDSQADASDGATADEDAPDDEPAGGETVVLLPTPTPTIAAPATPVDWLATATVEGDYYILGNPAAPIRLRDYSDFL